MTDLHVLIWWADFTWVASCLEHNMVAQGTTAGDATVSWLTVFKAQLDWTGPKGLGEPLPEALLMWNQLRGRVVKVHDEAIKGFQVHIWVAAKPG